MPSLKCLTRYSLLHCDKPMGSQWYHCYVALLLFSICFQTAWYNFSVLWEILIKWTRKQFSFDGQHGSKEAVTLGLGIIECFLFPGASKILRKRSDIIWVSAQTCTLYCFNLVTFHIRVWQLRKRTFQQTKIEILVLKNKCWEFRNIVISV